MPPSSVFYANRQWWIDAPHTPSRGLWFGDGVFETLRTYNGCPFQWKAHYQRLLSSTRAADMACPPEKELLALIQEALKRLNKKDARIRISVFRGNEPGKREKRAEVALHALSFSGYPRHYYKKGITLSFSTTLRLPEDVLSPRIKTTSLQAFVLAQLAKRSGFDVIYRNRLGFICECTTSNIFIIKRKNMLTPHLATGVLPGVTWKLIMDLGKELDLHPHQTFLSSADLYTADEVFITNSVFEILPVVQIENRTIGTGEPGKFTSALHDKLKQTIRKEARAWNTKRKLA